MKLKRGAVTERFSGLLDVFQTSVDLVTDRDVSAITESSVHQSTSGFSKKNIN